jgi:hypothetical protein
VYEVIASVARLFAESGDSAGEVRAAFEELLVELDAHGKPAIGRRGSPLAKTALVL